MAYDNSQAAQVVSFARPRHIPDVPQDVDFLLDHLNDPNYDIKSPLTTSTESFDYDDHKKKADDLDKTYSIRGSDYDTDSAMESTRYSTSSRMSDFTDFDEYAFQFKLVALPGLIVQQRITISRSPFFSI